MPGKQYTIINVMMVTSQVIVLTTEKTVII